MNVVAHNRPTLTVARRHHHTLDSAIRTLSAMSSVGPDDIALLDAAFDPIDAKPSGAALLDREPLAPFLLVSGFAAFQRVSHAGRVQILSVYLPGDIVGLDVATCPTGEGEIIALSPVRLRRLAPDRRASLAKGQGLIRAMAAAGRRQQQYLHDQIFRLGALSALQRTAHLLAELSARLAVSSGSDRPPPFPLRQEVLAQALGLSLVHVNRTLRRLREQGLAFIEHGALVIPDRVALLTAED